VAAIVPNVRRYVQLAQSRGGACFCTRGAMLDYDVVLFVLALAKTVTPPGGPRRGAGADRGASHKTASLVTQLSRRGATIAYTDLLATVYLF
jgi:hypothetical protein